MRAFAWKRKENAPTLPDLRREALLKEYGEVTSSFRSLTDIRFRLLGLLPLAAIATAALKDDKFSGPSFVLSVFGLVSTLGLITYNARNDQLYDELVGRAAAIERALGLPDGGFANRMLPWLTIDLGLWKWKVDHRTGISTVYAATVALWLFGILMPLVGGIRWWIDSVLPSLRADDPAIWIYAVAFAWAITLAWGGMQVIEEQKTRQQKQKRIAAAGAVNVALAIEPANALDDDTLIKACVRLLGGGEKAACGVRARAAFLQQLDRAEFDRFVSAETGKHRAAQVVALLTDYPPRWLLDCATDRTGAVARDAYDARVDEGV